MPTITLKKLGSSRYLRDTPEQRIKTVYTFVRFLLLGYGGEESSFSLE